MIPGCSKDPRRAYAPLVMLVCLVLSSLTAKGAASKSHSGEQLSREVRRVLSENCFKCHGPDSKDRKNGKKALRLDSATSAQADLGDGRHAIVPGDPDKSELIRRITTTDLDDKMPPPDSGKTLTPLEITELKKWILEGAEYSQHWAYVKPQRPALPKLQERAWPRNTIDDFILSRLEREKLKHSPEADRATLIRRVSLDLIGLPPTLADVDRFLNDNEPRAYERLVDRLLKESAFGEHWARLWLDQARYADSSGYADDPARTIWAYRDYVIRALNANMPFDRFTLEQIAGDLLDDPTDEQLIATAFHRNTMTNNEGGTSDEEYRNVAVVDRVNTTMAVWMGTTMACAQCHNHKYDPISQEEYFRLFAVLNNTADADRTDESPIHSLFTQDQKRQRKQWQLEITRLEKILHTPTEELEQAQRAWAKNFESDLQWQALQPTVFKSKAGATFRAAGDGKVQIARSGATDVYTLEVPVTNRQTMTALRLEVFPDSNPPGGGVGHANGNFVVSHVTASLTPSNLKPLVGRHLRIELPGKEKILSLAEVQVFSGASNVALRGEARQSSTNLAASAGLAIDGNTDGDFAKAKSTTHTQTSTDPWWEVDLGESKPIDRIVLWNRTDGASERLKGFRLLLLDEKRQTVWQQKVQESPNPSSEFKPDATHPIVFETALADFSQKDFNATNVLNNKGSKTEGWAIAPKFGDRHFLTLIAKTPTTLGPGSNFVVRIEQLSKFDYATIAQLRLSISSDLRARQFAEIPPTTLAILRQDSAQRTPAQRKEVLDYYLSIAPALQQQREELAAVKKQLANSKPYTTVPVLNELAADKRRKTHVQRRGNFLDLGKEVSEGLPSCFQVETASGRVDRLALARWLVNTNNPLTARVVANRLWESIFGIGLVRTSEEFGAQGEAPSHPELLDWLAVELMDSGWDVQRLLRLMVTSAAYRQSSRVTPEMAGQDPDNRLLARGPRFRLSAEMIRDQALFVSGLLSPKMYGPPVKPPQPKMGLTAAFGSATDWESSTGEDRYRRALYTTWRRSNPYPSMATFDAPNREVCLVRRERSNTPLQALVTLNDPVYVEAAQALARRIVANGSTAEEKVRHGFRLCASRQPTDEEVDGLTRLYGKALERFKNEPSKAKEAATKPLGEAPKGTDVTELAAWTVVSGVLLNLDEVLMKR